MSNLAYRCRHIDETEYPAAWGARTIHTADYLDVLPDRVDMVGSDENKAKLRAHLTEHLPKSKLDEQAWIFRGNSDEVHVLFEDDTVKVVASAQASYGYVYITAVLLPEAAV